MRRPALMSRASRGAARARVAGVGGRSRGATQTSSASRQKSIRRGTRGRAAGAARERWWLRGGGGSVEGQAQQAAGRRYARVWRATAGRHWRRPSSPPLLVGPPVLARPCPAVSWHGLRRKADARPGMAAAERGGGGQAKFPLFCKIRVNGKDAHPLYSYLKVAAKASRLGGGA